MILSQAPNLVFLKDTNGDDKYDTKQILIGAWTRRTRTTR